jgi:hypothetical protein
VRVDRKGIDEHIISQLIEARKILDSHAVPRGHRSAWMNKQTFLALGGTQRGWDSIEGDDEVKLIKE